MISVLPPSLHPHSRRYLWAPGLAPARSSARCAPESLLRHAEL